jgi:hypothetical protein
VARVATGVSLVSGASNDLVGSFWIAEGQCSVDAGRRLKYAGNHSVILCRSGAASEDPVRSWKSS